MGAEITEDQLRREVDAVLQHVEGGRSFTIVRAGEPIARLVPATRPAVRRADVLAAFANCHPIDSDGFRADIDSTVDQNPW